MSGAQLSCPALLSKAAAAAAALRQPPEHQKSDAELCGSSCSCKQVAAAVTSLPHNGSGCNIVFAV